MVTHQETITGNLMLSLAVVVTDGKHVLTGFLYNLRTKKVETVFISDPNLGSFRESTHVPGFFGGS